MSLVAIVFDFGELESITGWEAAGWLFAAAMYVGLWVLVLGALAREERWLLFALTAIIPFAWILTGAAHLMERR